MHFTDRMIMDGGLRRTGEGYAVTDARVARGGNVQLYLGSEMGAPDKATVRVYRPADEVFKREAIKSYAGVPITVGHPKDGVTADTWKALAVGEAGEDVVRDGEFVRVPLMLRDAAAIQAVERGTRELSMGYAADVTFEDGVSPSGEAYDAVMRNFRMNHVAIVDQARGGAELRIGDGAGKWGASPVTSADERTVSMTDNLRTVVVDGLSVQTTDQGAQAIDKLQKAIADAASKATATDTAHVAAIAAKDAVIVTKDEEIGTLKADLKKAQDAALKPADIDKLVADRAALLGTVKAIDAKIDPAGKSDADLRKAAVAAKLGDEMVKDASDAEIIGMFKALAKDVKAADPFAAALKDGIAPVADADKSVNDARAKMLADLQSGTISAKAS